MGEEMRDLRQQSLCSSPEDEDVEGENDGGNRDIARRWPCCSSVSHSSPYVIGKFATNDPPDGLPPRQSEPHSTTSRLPSLLTSRKDPQRYSTHSNEKARSLWQL